MALVNTIMTVMVAVIIGVGVTVPVVNDVIQGPCNAPNETADCTYNESPVSGTDALLAGFISTLVIAAIIYAVAQFF